MQHHLRWQKTNKALRGCAVLCNTERAQAGSSKGGAGAAVQCCAIQSTHRLAATRGAPALRLQETEPMGTAGPLKLAEEILSDGSGDPFFVLNRRARCSLPG